MKLHPDPHDAYHVVTAYGSDYIAVNGRVLTRSLLLLPDRLDERWGPDTFAELTMMHLAELAACASDIVLLGTGVRQCFPDVALLRPLIEAGRGYEVMDTGAACRTYNILAAAGRRVAAALILT